jgi:cytochrome b pre-mRNA-processing protein 3
MNPGQAERISVTFLKRILAPRRRPGEMAALYDAIVAQARRPHWYAEGGVPDTLDGRFEMVAGVLALVLIRLEALGAPAREPAARLTELFVADMDGQLRQSGIGDLVVGKHVGRMMSHLGGRIAAYRDGLAGGDVAGALARNLYRGAAVPEAALAHGVDGMRGLAARLATRDLPALLTGDLG